MSKSLLIFLIMSLCIHSCYASTNTTVTNTSDATNTTSNVTNTSSNTVQPLDNGLDTNSDLTRVSEPALVTSTLLSLPFSPKESIFIGSQRLEAFQVIANGSQTRFKVTYYDGKETSSYEMSLTGAWTHVKSSSKTLSCNVVREDGTQRYAFLKFDSSTNPPTISQASMVTNPGVDLSSSQIGTDCLRIKTSSNTIYRIGTSQLVQLSIPSGTLYAANERLNYIIVNNELYNFRTGGTWGSLRTLTARSTFGIESAGPRVVIYGSDAALSSSTYTVTQDVYILAIDSTNTVTTIFEQTIAAKDSTTDYVPLHTSPMLTKVLWQYTDSATSAATYTVKSIQATTNSMTDMSFQLLSGFEEITSGLTYGFSNFYLGDSYIVVRSATEEQGFQFASNKIISVRKRTLGTSEQNHASSRIMINQEISDQLAVVDLTLNTATTPDQYDINEHLFGSLATNYQFQAAASAAFFEYTEPTNTGSASSTIEYFWVYVNAGASSTTVTAQHLAPGQTNNRIQYSEQVTGVWSSILAKNTNCILLKKTTSEYLLLRNSGMTQATATQVDLTSTITGLSSAKTHFYLSTSCDKLSIDKTTILLYSSATGQYSAIATAPQYNAADLSLTYLFVASTNSLWKYSSSTSSYTQYHTGLQADFTSSTLVKASGSRLLLAAGTSSSIRVDVLSDNGSSLSEDMSQSLTGFSAMPLLTYAPDFSNIVVYGVDASSAAKVHGFARSAASVSSVSPGKVGANTLVNYETVSIPTSDIVDPSNILIAVTANWLYIRQLANAVQAAGTNKQFIYAFSQTIFTVFVADYTISATDEASWLTTRLSQTSSGDLNIYNQIQQSSATTIRINDLEVLASQVETAESGNDETAVIVVDGQIELCLTGCNDCSSGVCSGCSQGFVLSSNLCYACDLNCKTCNANNPDICYTCMDGNYLSGTSCVACDSNCVTCSGSSTACILCKPKQYWNGTACTACPRNCKTCTSSGCTKCRKGFALKTDGSACRTCSIHCSDCNPDSITTCTACGKGLYLSSNAQCLQCPDNCRRCNNGLCAKCIRGYKPNAAGQCVLNCQFPCANCVDNQPSNCTSCYRFSLLNTATNTCAADTSCNADSSCTKCGPGYALVGAQCLQCPDIPNCKQCSRTNLQNCARCDKGYYPNGDVCQVCPTGCRRCRSSQVCNSCINGYTLLSTSTDDDAEEEDSICEPCTYPCKTCIGVTTYCKTCESGFSKQGWKCRNNRNVAFNIVLGASSVAEVMNILDDVVTRLLTLLNKPTEQVELIVFSSIALGSVDMSGTYSQDSTTDSQVESEASLLSSGLQGTTIGGVSVTSSSVTANGISTTTTDSGSSSSNTGLIVGLAVGIPCFLLIVFIVIFVVYRYKKAAAVDGDLDVEVEAVRQHTQMAEKAKPEQAFEEIDDSGAPNLAQDFKKFQMDLPNESDIASEELPPPTSYPTQPGFSSKVLNPDNGMLGARIVEAELISVQSSASRMSKGSSRVGNGETQKGRYAEMASDEKSKDMVNPNVTPTLRPHLLELDLPSQQESVSSESQSDVSSVLQTPNLRPEATTKMPAKGTEQTPEKYHVTEIHRQYKTAYGHQTGKSMNAGFPVMSPEPDMPKTERIVSSESSSEQEEVLEPEPIKVTVNPTSEQHSKQVAPVQANPFVFELDLDLNNDEASLDSQSVQ